MIHLSISEEDKDILAEMLENEISDLRMEIANTDSLDFREALKRQKESLRRILETLQHQTKEDI